MGTGAALAGMKYRTATERKWGSERSGSAEMGKNEVSGGPCILGLGVGVTPRNFSACLDTAQHGGAEQRSLHLQRGACSTKTLSYRAPHEFPAPSTVPPRGRRLRREERKFLFRTLGFLAAGCRCLPMCRNPFLPLPVCGSSSCCVAAWRCSSADRPSAACGRPRSWTTTRDRQRGGGGRPRSWTTTRDRQRGG